MQDTQAIGSYTLPLSYVPAAPRLFDWWERWRALLPLLLFVCLVGQFVTPMVPDLRLSAILLQLATSAFAWYVFWRVSRLIYGTRAERKANKAAGILTANLYSPSNLGLTTANLSSMSSGYLLIPNIIAFPFMSQAFLLFAFLGSCSFMFAWPHKIALIENILASRRNVFLVNIVSFVVMVLAFAFIWVGFPHFLRGSSASWPDLLAFAQHQADNSGSDAVLDSVLTRPITNLYSSFDTSSPLQLTFTFSTNQGSIEVTVADTNPPRFISSQDSKYINSNRPSADLNTIKSRVASVKYSPRELYIQTEAEGRKFALANQSNPDDPIVTVSMYPSTDHRELRGAETVWNVSYGYKTPTGYATLILRIDAASGEILEREEF